MALNPLVEKGIKLEDQFRDWSELSPQPYDKCAVAPYTRMVARIQGWLSG